jgi:DNA processing protein
MQVVWHTAGGTSSTAVEEAAVFAAVTADESPVDRIIERCGLPAHTVIANLMKLELRRLVRAFPGFRYARR